MNAALFSHVKISALAATILVVMLAILVASVWDESAIIDELAHIPAGFGYVLAQDYRLNPEHPPLIKTLGALSAQFFARPNFPFDTPAWRDDVNGQWTQGAIFLYESGNDADKIIFWSRIPLILLAVAFGWLLFLWTRIRFGRKAALLTLVLFAFSPTFLTHSRYVTTDLGAAFGFFIGIAGFLYFLERQTWKRAFTAGLLFGAAQLFKFSLVLLVPLYIFFIAAWVATLPRLHIHERLRLFFKSAAKTGFIFLVGLAVIWAIYLPHVKNYPQDKQIRDAEFILSSHPNPSAASFNLALMKNPITRPLGQYMLGALMVNQRASGGNTVYFLGDVAATGSPYYFPLLFMVKEPLALHVLIFIAAWFAIRRTWQSQRRPDKNLAAKMSEWIHAHFAEFASLAFIIFYWGLSIASPLNIGIRHVLPTFPFIYILVAKYVSAWLESHVTADPQNWFDWLRNIYALYIKSIPKYIVVAVLLLWFALSSAAAFPNFMTYYNELAGGSPEGYKIAVDSNYDWGQDLKRLLEYVEKNNIDSIGVDYFGGGHVEYYFGSRAFRWNSSKGPLHGWFAISATLLQGATANPVKGFQRTPEESYEWLRPYVPVARVGSIFVYKLP